MRCVGLALLLLGCKTDTINAGAFTIHPDEGGSCALIVDLSATRDSSNVDLQVRVCDAKRCSALWRDDQSSRLQG